MHIHQVEATSIRKIPDTEQKRKMRLGLAIFDILVQKNVAVLIGFCDLTRLIDIVELCIKHAIAHPHSRYVFLRLGEYSTLHVENKNRL